MRTSARRSRRSSTTRSDTAAASTGAHTWRTRCQPPPNRRPALPALADELHFAHTPDGWRLALHRHAAGPPELGLPVILCPGYACNRHFIDWDAEYSLARFLARRGFDAWVIELRGRGLSHPTPACAAPRTWTFDDLALHDVPTAVRHVARMTRRRVAWVGHSMGGMLLYASLGGPGGAELPIVAGV